MPEQSYLNNAQFLFSKWCALGGTGSSTEVYYVNSRPTSGRCRPFTAGPDRSSISLEVNGR
ncbi:hypothetical protein DPMN_003593 [Dreissena polymorpha]|uniref:Uncharacterized protein n=1 Tax=Dreissena polymorpha TaxID=45954 RepID=A0A9D4MQZ2_DREPO|nr:hypothetical protein DPMN_003593 [Dreissena polymorpha]